MGWTPLNSAAGQGHQAVVLLLLQNKAAIDTANNVSGMRDMHAILLMLLYKINRDSCFEYLAYLMVAGFSKDLAVL